jgi:predicted small secreted protein
MLFRNEDYKDGLAREYIENAKDRGSELSYENALKSVQTKIEQDSHNMALNWVRMTQFEYTASDRSNIFGGGTNNASVIGNSLFQFFPYAAHMFEMNARVYREGLGALKRGEINNWKFGAMARMFAFQTFGVGLASIVLNNEFKYLIENDTFGRLENLYGLLTAENSQEMSDVDFGNGLIQQFSGPVVSDMLFWMEAAGFAQLGNDDLTQLLLGTQKFRDMSESEQDISKLNRVSVSLAKVIKSKESFIDGDIMGIIRNNLLLYPSARTQKGREKLLDLLGLETNSQKRRSQEEQVRSTLLNIPEEQRKKILGIIDDLKQPSEDNSRIPTGLQNLSIR